MGPHISFDISTTDGSNFHSDTPHPLLFYFHPLLYSLFLLPPLFPIPVCSCRSFRSRLLRVISPSCLCLSFHFFPSTFCHFALFLPLTTFFQPSFSYMYVLLSSSPLFVASLVLNCLSVFVSASSGRPPQLVCFPLLNLSTCLYLWLLSAMTLPSHLSLFYLSLSVSPSSFSNSLFLYFPQQLCFVALTADKPADKGGWEHI